jgi:hypothetical protein
MSITDLFRQPRQSSVDVFPRAEPWRPHVVDGDHDVYLANVPRLSVDDMVQHVIERGYTPEELQRIGAEIRAHGFNVANGRLE